MNKLKGDLLDPPIKAIPSKTSIESTQKGSFVSTIYSNETKCLLYINKLNQSVYIVIAKSSSGGFVHSRWFYKIEDLESKTRLIAIFKEK